MKILRAGHRYILENFTHPESDGQVIQFIEKGTELGKESEKSLPLVTIYDGTTNEDVLAVLIDRLNYLNGKFPCRENSVAITHIETALLWLQKRTADRIARGVEGLHKS